MMENNSPPISPVCYLPETSDHYAGYFTLDEIDEMIRRWMDLAPRPEIAALLADLLPIAPAPAGSVAHTTPKTATVSGASLWTEIRRSLPHIRNDDLHRALSDIADHL